jgi:hypothetical protein
MTILTKNILSVLGKGRGGAIGEELAERTFRGRRRRHYISPAR